MTDYLRAWQLEPSAILNRPRIANRRLTKGQFVDSRGIPSYSEGTRDFIFGTDLLAAEYRALSAFPQISDNGSLAQTTQQTAAEIQALLERVGWSKQGQHYFGAIRKDLSGYGSADTPYSTLGQRRIRSISAAHSNMCLHRATGSISISRRKAIFR